MLQRGKRGHKSYSLYVVVGPCRYGHVTGGHHSAGSSSISNTKTKGSAAKALGAGQQRRLTYRKVRNEFVIGPNMSQAPCSYQAPKSYTIWGESIYVGMC